MAIKLNQLHGLFATFNSLNKSNQDLKNKHN
jgi:hypothetical protein